MNISALILNTEFPNKVIQNQYDNDIRIMPCKDKPFIYEHGNLEAFTANYSDRLYSNTICADFNNEICPIINTLNGNPFPSYKPIGQYLPPIRGDNIDIPPYIDNWLTPRLNELKQYPVTCSYPLSSFADVNNVQTFYQSFLTDKNASTNNYNFNVYNEYIMPYFCSFESNECPVDPFKTDGSVLSSCSNFISTSTGGTFCRVWSASNEDLADQVKQAYCAQRLTANECLCINKLYDPNYYILKQDIMAPDFCWYSPCSNSSQYLVPKYEQKVDSCPDVCGIILNTYNYNDSSVIIDLSNANISIDCSRSVDSATLNPDNPSLKSKSIESSVSLIKSLVTNVNTMSSTSIGAIIVIAILAVFIITFISIGIFSIVRTHNIS
jgi:hypothetical protein